MITVPRIVLLPHPDQLAFCLAVSSLRSALLVQKCDTRRTWHFSHLTNGNICVDAACELACTSTPL